jgi:hypothetical protein
MCSLMVGRHVRNHPPSTRKRVVLKRETFVANASLALMLTPLLPPLPLPSRMLTSLLDISVNGESNASACLLPVEDAMLLDVPLQRTPSAHDPPPPDSRSGHVRKADHTLLCTVFY